MIKFAVTKCGQCGANLSKRAPGNVIEVKPHPGEPDIKKWSYAPCPKCGAGVPVTEESEPAPRVNRKEPESGSE
jgi:ribosomal protein S27AE